MQQLEMAKTTTKQISDGKWAGRFIWASILQGVGAVFWTLFMVAPGITPDPSRVIAGGSGGTWFFVGYSLYILVGVIAVAVTALFYFYIESVQGKSYTGYRKYLAWAHLVLMNVGVVGATWLMMVAGYQAGSALLPTNVGGLGWTSLQVHQRILDVYPPPIGAFLLVTVLGVMAGGLGYLLSGRSRMPKV